MLPIIHIIFYCQLFVVLIYDLFAVPVTMYLLCIMDSNPVKP